MAAIGLKRANGYDEYADTKPYKQAKDGRMTTRLLLLGKYCGAIVGKGGEIVKKLREKHGVQISGLNRHTDHRVLSVQGERDNIINALRDILPVAALEAPNPASKQQKCNYEINLLVPGGHIGAVIGKGGSKIREITEVSEGKIQVHQESLHNSNERIVAIGGESVERVIDAIDIIFDTLQGLPKKDDEMLYEPKDDPSVSTGGRSDNSNGAASNVRRAQEQSIALANANSQLSLALSGGNQMMNNNQLAAYQLGATPQQQLGFGNSLGSVGGLNMAAPSLIGQLSVAGQGGGGGGFGGLGGALQGGGMLGMGRQGLNMAGGGVAPTIGGNQTQLQAGFNRGQLGNQMNNQLMNQGFNVAGRGAVNNNSPQLDFTSIQTKTELTVSPEMCGAIIGKGGKSINTVKAATGVKIVITGNEKGTKEDRVMTITGTQQQIQAAEQMLTENVRSYRK